MSERFQPTPTIIIKDIKPLPEGSLINGRQVPVPSEQLKNLFDLSRIYNEDFCMVLEGTRLCVVVNEDSEFAIDALEDEIIEKSITYDPELLIGSLATEVNIPDRFTGPVEELLADKDSTFHAINWATERYNTYYGQYSKITEEERNKQIQEKRRTAYSHLGLLQRTKDNPRRYNGNLLQFRSIAQAKLSEYILNGQAVHGILSSSSEQVGRQVSDAVIFANDMTME
jgi:hypothetical protein